MKYSLSLGGTEKEIPKELAEELLDAEGIRFQIRKARDNSFSDVFVTLKSSLKKSPDLEYIFMSNEDVSVGDVLFNENVGELTVTRVEVQKLSECRDLLRVYVRRPPAVDSTT